MAMRHQAASTTPNGQAPERKPYALDRAHPKAKPRMNLLPRPSSAHITIMNVRATTPNPVVQLIGREVTGGRSAFELVLLALLRGHLMVETR